MTAILRSSLVGLDEQDLAHLALTRDSMQSPVSPCLFDVLIKAESPLPSVKQEKVAAFLKLFNKWRSLSRRNGVAPLLRTILDDTEYLPCRKAASGLPTLKHSIKRPSPGITAGIMACMDSWTRFIVCQKSAKNYPLLLYRQRPMRCRL